MRSIEKHSAPRSRASRRGAALLEGVAVVAACSGLLSLGLALHAREVARLERQRELRASAWQRALGGCAGPERVGVLAGAALAGRAARAVEQLSGRVPALADERQRPLVPCNEPATSDERAWPRTETDLEQQVLPSLP